MKAKLVVGLTVTMLLVTMVFGAIPVRAAPDNIVIGLIGPKGWIQWDGIKQGAAIAAGLINTAGGMGKSGNNVTFVEIDEHAVPTPQPDLGRRDLIAALDAHPDMDFLIGGFRSECVIPIREAAMDYASANSRPIWFITGSATTKNLLKTDDNYDRYKYMFRATPPTTKAMIYQITNILRTLILPKVEYAKGETPGTGKIYIVAEALEWLEDAVPTLQTNFTTQIVGTARPSSIETDFSSILADVEAKHADVIIHIFSAVAGASFIRQWGQLGVSAVPVGINVESEMQEFYASVGGLCNYETYLQALPTQYSDACVLNPLAKPLTSKGFWDKTVQDYGHAPIYTAQGAYDTVLTLNETYADWSTKANCAAMIPTIEATTHEALTGHFKYTGPGGIPERGVFERHDLYVSDDAFTMIWPTGYGRPQIVQWQNGIMRCVWPRGNCSNLGVGATEPLAYAGKYKLPPQMELSSTGVSIVETDFAGNTAPSGVGPDLYMPNGVVDTTDVGAVTTYWQQKVPWSALEADMDGNQIITVSDIGRVALDYGLHT